MPLLYLSLAIHSIVSLLPLITLMSFLLSSTSFENHISLKIYLKFFFSSYYSIIVINVRISSSLLTIFVSYIYSNISGLNYGSSFSFLLASPITTNILHFQIFNINKLIFSLLSYFYLKSSVPVIFELIEK